MSAPSLPADVRVGMLPTFVVIGAMRSGTTSLASNLRMHPEVFVPDRKELHFFDKRFDRGVGWYARQFAGVTTERAVGEATPNYMYRPEAIDRMAGTVPDIRLVAILRNPVDRAAYSRYWRRVARGREPLSFADAITAKRSGSRRGISRPGSRPRTSIAAATSSSSGTSASATRGRGARRDLRGPPSRPDGQVRVALPVPRSGRHVRPAAPRHGDRGLQDVPVTLRGPPLRHLPPKVDRLLRRFNSRTASYPKMDPALRGQLIERMRPDNEALAAWLGRDLRAWSW